MYKRNITYTDYNGDEKTETFYFNLSKHELVNMNYSKDGGYENYARAIIEANNGKEIIDTVEELILSSYGEKSPDGRRFVKSKELSEEFSQTAAYDALFTELCTDADKAAEFFNNIVPKDMQQSPDKLKAQTQSTLSLLQ